MARSLLSTLRAAALTATLTASLAACGGGSPDTASEAFAEAIATNCDKAFACEAAWDAAMQNDTPFADAYGASVDACVERYEALFAQLFGADFAAKLDASVEAGRIVYDADAAGVCLAAIEAATCDEFFEQNGAVAESPPECDTTFVGTVATGGSCTLDEDCAVDGDACSPETMLCTSA